jgi:hypothetical protein
MLQPERLDRPALVVRLPPPWRFDRPGWSTSSRRVTVLVFVGLPRNPVVLWPNHCKSCGLGVTSMPILFITCLLRSSWLGLGFVDQPRNLVVLWPNDCKPRAQTSVISHYPASAPCSGFCLALLSTMHLALHPVCHEVPQTKLACLSTPWSPHRHRPFMLVLHLHQRKSSRNMHLQY